MPRTEIYLVPGFLGFGRLAGLDYYIDVADVLRDRLRDAGFDAVVHSTETIAAGSLRKRAKKLAEELVALHDPAVDSVHLVGHSTGALDARVLLSPGSDLDAGDAMRAHFDAAAFARYADILPKVKSAVGVAAPHSGTPLAGLAVRLSFDAVLAGTSTAVRNPLVRGALALGLRAGASLVDLVQKLPLDTPFLDWIDAEILSEDPRAVIEFLDRIGIDTGALRNLTQEGTDLANALLLDRPGVAYASAVTGAAAPVGFVDTEDPLIYANTLFYRAAWLLASRHDPDYPYPSRLAEMQAVHDADAGAGLDVGSLLVSNRINDGIVPTASQPHGELLAVLASDHLDCVGHYPHRLADGTNVSGWVRSGASFSTARFELLWQRVADLVVRTLTP